jgi:hypothetical protein
MTNEEVETFVDYMIAKHSWLIDHPDLPGVIATVVADTLLVESGDLSVEDFKPRRTT